MCIKGISHNNYYNKGALPLNKIKDDTFNIVKG